MSLENRSFSEVITKEMITLIVIIGTGYLLEIIAISALGHQLYLSRPFWQNPQFYFFWENSIRENAQIIKVLGYPIYSLIRFFLWFTRHLAGGPTGNINTEEAKVKKIVEDIIKEIKLRRKIDKVEYRPSNFWYIIRFYSPPNCIIPKNHIDNYISSNGKFGRDQIAECLLKNYRDAA